MEHALSLSLSTYLPTYLPTYVYLNSMVAKVSYHQIILKSKYLHQFTPKCLFLNGPSLPPLFILLKRFNSKNMFM